MPDQPLQEAIAKAAAIRDAHDGYSLHPSDPKLVMACRSCDHMTRWPCPTREAAQVILDSLTPLRADGDTRYVAITRGQRQWLTYLQQHCPSILDVCKAYDAYDAVAPNAKDHA